MSAFSLATTGMIIRTLEKTLPVKIRVEGLENLVDNPTLFVVNHFTRIETFIIPYVIFKHHGKIVRSLADDALFQGKFGEYLTAIGAVSTRESVRNRLILHDLLTNHCPWVIYPEGLMVKSKKVLQKGKYYLSSPSWQGPPRSGASVLALKTEILRMQYLNWRDAGEDLAMADLFHRYNIVDAETIQDQETVIVPVNVTYYPIRPGQNVISKLAEKYMHGISPRLKEELQLEGNILFTETDILIYFGKPVYVRSLLKTPVDWGNKIFSFFNQNKRNQWVIWYQKDKLTQMFMDKIYTQVSVHLDHLVCMALKVMHAQTISLNKLSVIIYLTALMIRKNNRRVHTSLQKQFIHCVIGKPFAPLENILKQVTQDKIITVDDQKMVTINWPQDTQSTFHEIRLDNIAEVIANEFEPLKDDVSILMQNCARPEQVLKDKLVHLLVKKDYQEFQHDYDSNYHEKFSKSPTIGAPFFLFNPSFKHGVVLSHGFLSAPEEIKLLAEYLHQHRLNVYGVRLKGMGTVPWNLESVRYKDWLHSYQRGIAIIRHSCQKIIWGGFSSGGLIGLNQASADGEKPEGVFCINSPIFLADIKTRLVSACLAWNDLLNRLNIDKGRMEFVESSPENPEINYNRIYLKSLKELNTLIEHTKDSLKGVSSPLLVIQSDKDPIVEPRSGQYIFDHVASASKEIELMSFDRHVIVRKSGRERVFERILRFITQTIGE